MSISFGSVSGNILWPLGFTELTTVWSLVSPVWGPQSLQELMPSLGFGEGLRWLLFAKANTCRAKISEIYRGSLTAVLDIDFFSGESC